MNTKFRNLMFDIYKDMLMTGGCNCSCCREKKKCLPVSYLDKDCVSYFKNHLNLTDYSPICSDCNYKSLQEIGAKLYE